MKSRSEGRPVYCFGRPAEGGEAHDRRPPRARLIRLLYQLFPAVSGERDAEYARECVQTNTGSIAEGALHRTHCAGSGAHYLT
jgi:hypothetical protein